MMASTSRDVGVEETTSRLQPGGVVPEAQSDRQGQEQQTSIGTNQQQRQSHGELHNEEDDGDKAPSITKVTTKASTTSPVSSKSAQRAREDVVEGEDKSSTKQLRKAMTSERQSITTGSPQSRRSVDLSRSNEEQRAREADAPPGKEARARQVSTASVTPGRLSELKRFTLWETRTHFYLVAYNTSQTAFRILKVDRIPETRTTSIRKETASSSVQSEASTATSKPTENVPNAASHEATVWNLNVTADSVVYTRSQVSELLDMISEGNKSAGGLRELGRFFGIIGFIRFTSTYYMVLISRRSVVALLGGHYIYHCDETKIIPVCPQSILANVGGRTKAMDQEEARLLHSFKQVDLSKNFYFSYTYDLTKTLQDNLTLPESHDDPSATNRLAWGYNEKFVWNHHLLLPAFAASQHAPASDSASEWVLPLVYGFVDQAKLRVLNCTIHVTLIARRSRHFAGARFLKRGTDERGNVANDVETEQIVNEALVTPFYAPQARRGGIQGAARGPNPHYTSYVMHRGSIPIYWTQDSTNMSPRPPIEISVADPYYSSAALHFDDMLRKYGHPIIVLNLIKSKEKQPREVKLLNAFSECVKYLNQFLPTDKRIRYIAWDMSRASKSRDQDVIGVLEDIAEETINTTNFFHSGPEPSKFTYRYDASEPVKQSRDSILLQSGVARVNCVDCLDRTNAAQFVIGKAALGHQLYALGLLDHPALPFDSDAIDMLTEMYHDLGDTIALQYGGSHLVNTMETYRKINQWTSHSRDMLEGLKRYYANSFVDAEKQAAINLFLGVDNDAPDFRHVDGHKRRDYQKWYTLSHLEAESALKQRQARLYEIVGSASSFWAEYYRPSLFTDLMRHHAFKMTAIHQQVALPSLQLNQVPPSPTSSHSAGQKSPALPPSTNSSPKMKAPGRLRTFSGTTLAQTETTMSPFISRVALPPIGEVSSSPSQSKAPPAQQQAIMGGVRRWISLNRGDDEGRQSTLKTTSAPRKSTGRKGNELGNSNAVKDDAGEEESAGLSLRGQSAWPTWEEITGANLGAPPTEILLDHLLNPSVSPEEAREYGSWLDQFRDVAFDAGSQEIPPSDLAASQSVRSGLSPIQHNLSTAVFPPMQGRMNLHSTEPSHVTGVTGGGAGGLSTLNVASNFTGPHHLPWAGVRKPATQKQRQQVAEADARLYDHEVALTTGQISSLDGMVGALGSDTQKDSKRGIEPALLQYVAPADSLQAGPSDAKLRAYTRWLAGHHQGLPLAVAPAST